jgi:hypothetical protein
MDTRDNNSMSLYWVVEGIKPIPGLKEENIALKQEILKEQLLHIALCKCHGSKNNYPSELI